MDIRRIIDLRARDDREVPAILLTPEPDRSGAVLVHDFGGCKEDLLSLLVELGQLGVAVVAIDLAGHGNNKSVIGPRVLHEVEAALSFMRRRFEHVGCAGVGFGARLALMSSADYVAAVSPIAVATPGGAGELQELLSEIGPVRPHYRPCLLLCGEHDPSAVIRAVEEFHLLLPRSEVRQVPTGALAGNANRGVNDLPGRMIGEILSLNAQAVEVIARWLAQMPGFLRFAAAQESRSSAV
jgi:dienelactone hydrolase